MITFSGHDAPVRMWLIIALLSALVASTAWVQWWRYQSASRAALDALAFNEVEKQLTQPAFAGISTELHGKKYSPHDTQVTQDFVHLPDSIKLDETIGFSLQPLATSTDCSPSDIESIRVSLDAPAFTVDTIGDPVRSLERLRSQACDLAAQAPPPPAPWRWNVVPTQAGHRLITLSLQALDKNQRVVDSRIVDIPVTVLAPPESLSTVVGTLGGVITLLSTVIGLWGRAGKDRTQPTTSG